MAKPGMGMNITQGQFQQLRMTPQLQQAIKLLQLSRLEFENAIMEEMEKNPVLEEIMDGIEEGQAPDPMNAEMNTELTGSTDQPVNENTLAETANQDPKKQDEFEWENYLDTPNKAPRDLGGNNEEIMNYENMISSTQSLYDHLIWQLNLAGFNDEEYQIASVLVSYVDEDGYIKTPFEEIAREESVTVQDLEEILPFVQEFDPPGVGARNLQECLLVQAKVLGEDTNDLVHVITHHMKDLEKKNYEGIAKAMGKELQEVVELCKIVLEMDPKPGHPYMADDTQYVTPDVYVYKVGDDYIVALNDDGLPRLRISNFYQNALKSGNKDTKDKEAQDYIKDKLKSALFLIMSIQRRQKTIHRVAESIVKYQRDFFDKGPGFIKPMILRDVANDVGIHESTVSRVTSNKYMHSPRGIFELKYFFNSGIATTNGESLASESVKMKIRDLVAKELPKDPLSDQKLVELLKIDGIEIARRTVAKYRDDLNILPSSKRKKYF